MKNTQLKLKSMFKQALLLSAVILTSTHTYAQTINLCVATTTITMPSVTTVPVTPPVVVTMWGFGLDVTPGTPALPGACIASVPGPEIIIPVGDPTLVINLRNTLPEAVSIMIPGLTSPAALAPLLVPVRNANNRIRSFTHETAIGATGIYTFNAKPGTFLYQSGTHIAKQMQMGLYGAVINDNSTAVAAPAAPATVYPGISYDKSVTLLYSEIDPEMHLQVANGTYGTGAYTSTINYAAKYFLVNGVPYSSATPLASTYYGGTPGSTILFRLLNAGLETHVPVFNGQYIDVVAEYGNAYPFAHTQYSIMLAAGQTRDAILTAAVAGDFIIYDRRLRLTNSNLPGPGGLYSVITVAAVNPNPITAGKQQTSAAADTVQTGGGCSLAIASAFDPLLPMLLLLSFIYFIRRAVRKK